jgi:two-component system sensor histidine kinase TtrS
LARQIVCIGVLAYRGPSEAIDRWSATAAYLNAELSDYEFKIAPLTVDSTESAVVNADIGFLLTNPGNFVDLASRFGIARIATLRSNQSATLGGGSIGAAIFVLAERTDLQNLSDLKGRTLAAVAPDSFDDFQVAWGEMHRQGIDPFTDLGALKFVGLPKDSVVRAVGAGAADAGVARSGC